MSQFLTTDCVEPHERVEYWIDMICDTFVQLECDAGKDSLFSGAIQRQVLPGLDMSRLASRAQDVFRTPRHISKATDDYFLVSIQTRGLGRVTQDGKAAFLHPGDFALYDSTREYQLHFEGDFEQIVLKLPAERLRNAVKDTSQLTATTVSGKAGAGQLLITMINTLWDDVDSLQPASAAAVADGALNILVAGLKTLPAACCEGLSSLANFHLARIKQIIQSRLADPTLSIGDIAREVGISVSHIHRLFRNEATSPTHYIWNQRLEGCRRDLLDPRLAKHSISEVAFSWGFNDAAHFSRAFREHFGESPRDWRAIGGPRPS